MKKVHVSNNRMGFSEEEWLQYAEKYDTDGRGYEYDSWQMYVWTKDNDGNIVPDVSKKNILRCKKLYEDEPKNNNNVIRWLWINIVVGKWNRSLMEKVLKRTNNEDFSSVIFRILVIFLLLGLFYKSRIKRYYTGIRRFLKDVIKNDGLMKLWRKEVNEDPEDLCDFLDFFSNVCGREYVLNNINLDFIRRDFSLEFAGDFNPDLFFVLVEHYYKKHLWLDALYFYERIKLINEKKEITDYEPIMRFSQYDFIEKSFKDDVLLKDIKDRINDCLYNIVKEDNAIGILSLLDELISRCDNYLNAMFKLSRSLVGISLIKSLVENDFLSFRNGANEWLSRVRQLKNSMFPYFHDVFISNLMGSYLEGDEKEVEKMLTIINSKKDITVTLGNYFIVVEIEKIMREFIKLSLEKEYGRYKSWYLGVPIEIRKKAASRQEEDPRSNKWDCLDFSDYADIISYKNNWDNIFKKYFLTINPSVSNAKKHLAIFRKLPDLRNVIAHNRRKLTKEEKKYC